MTDPTPDPFEHPTGAPCSDPWCADKTVPDGRTIVMTDTIDPTTARQVLDLPLPANDAEASTIRGYLIELLAKVWEEGEGFSGKRPFGNSGWEWDLFPPLITAGLVGGRIGEDGYIEDVDDLAAHRLIHAAIRQMGVPAHPTSEG